MSDIFHTAGEARKFVCDTAHEKTLSLGTTAVSDQID